MRARSARRLSVLPARTQLSSVDRSSAVNVRAVGYLLMPHHGIDRLSLQLSTGSDAPALHLRRHHISAAGRESCCKRNPGGFAFRNPESPPPHPVAARPDGASFLAPS